MTNQATRKASYAIHSSNRIVHDTCHSILRTSQKISMTEPNSPTSQLIPEQTALEIRRIAHELSNSLEVIVQTSYLLGMAELPGPAAEWLRMLDSGVTKALEQNLALREFIKKNS